jgi:exodeoxyribonuclease V alpha subunit
VISGLKKIGFSYTASVKIYDAYGDEAEAIVCADPYRIAVEIPGIGFKTADAVAEALLKNQASSMQSNMFDTCEARGFTAEDTTSGRLPASGSHRTEAGILYILSRYAAEGHTCVPKTKLIERAAGLLDIAGENVEDCLLSLFVVERVSEAAVDGVPHIFLDRYLLAERHVCSDLMRLMQADRKPLYADPTDLISEEEALLGIELSDGQRRAIGESLERGVFVLTGGPGTGKTTIIKAIIGIFRRAGLKTAVAAPTGRAAKRVSEATGHEASTIHRLLEYYYDEYAREMHFGRNGDKRLEQDAVIIDEASMVDSLLMEALLTAMKTGARLVIVGDADQLPPVGAGNVLRDIIGSERVQCAELTEIYRQAAESMIVVNAHRIDRGEYPDMAEYGDRESDFIMIRISDSAAAVRAITDLCSKELPAARTGPYPPHGIQVLTPMKRGTLGNAKLNEALQHALNPSSVGKEEIKRGERIFRTGDRVMQTRNNYSLEWVDSANLNKGRGIFNGDMGIILGINGAAGEVTVAYDETKCVIYGKDGLDDIEHAYAITVHKSQGSEFPVVVMPIYAAAPPLMTRNLIYTAITRARNLVVLVGSEPRLLQMVDNGGALKRYSGLRSFLAEYSDMEISDIGFVE